FQQRRLHLFHRGTKSLATRRPERMFVGIDRVIRTIDQLDLEIHERIAGDGSLRRRLDNSFLDCRSKLLRHRATEDLVFKNKPATTRQRLKHTLAIAKLSATASLFLVSTLDLRALRDCLFVRNFRRMKSYFHAVTLLQLLDNRFDVQLSRA